MHFHFMFLQSTCIRIDIHFLHTDAFFFSGGNTCIKREDFCRNTCSELSNANKPASVESSLSSAGINFNMIFFWHVFWFCFAAGMLLLVLVQ